MTYIYYTRLKFSHVTILKAMNFKVDPSILSKDCLRPRWSKGLVDDRIIGSIEPPKCKSTNYN